MFLWNQTRKATRIPCRSHQGLSPCVSYSQLYASLLLSTALPPSRKTSINGHTIRQVYCLDLSPLFVALTKLPGWGAILPILELDSLDPPSHRRPPISGIMM